MAAVSVFVDDAVRGRLPLVCAKTGEPADLVIRMQQPVGGGLSAAPLLLLFLGPIGLVALFFLSLLTPGREYLTVRVPQTEGAYERERSLKQFRTAAIAAGVATILFAVLFRGAGGVLPSLWLALGAALLVAAVALQVMIRRQTIGISLDASRRWVTLTNVHPAFARAADAEEAAGRVGATPAFGVPRP